MGESVPEQRPSRKGAPDTVVLEGSQAPAHGQGGMSRSTELDRALSDVRVAPGGFALEDDGRERELGCGRAFCCIGIGRGSTHWRCTRAAVINIKLQALDARVTVEVAG